MHLYFAIFFDKSRQKENASTVVRHPHLMQRHESETCQREDGHNGKGVPPYSSRTAPAITPVKLLPSHSEPYSDPTSESDPPPGIFDHRAPNVPSCSDGTRGRKPRRSSSTTDGGSRKAPPSTASCTTRETTWFTSGSYDSNIGMGAYVTRS